MQRTMSLVILVLAVAATTVGAQERTLVLNLAKGSTSGRGIAFVKDSEESENRIVERSGSDCVQEDRYFYIQIADKQFVKGGLPLITVTFEYFDEGKGRRYVSYDSSDKYHRANTKNPGVWKTRSAFALGNSRKWKTATVVIDDAYFDNRCNGSDFRLQGGTVFIRKVTVVAADAAAQRKNRLKLKARKPPVTAKIKKFTLTEEEILDAMGPYDGPSKKGVDTKTMKGKVMCGYQGWFNAAGDDSGLGFKHYNGPEGFKPGSCTIDYWPHTEELDADEKYKTPFKYKDGSTAYVYSSRNRKTVVRHFKWMEEAGIDGVFLQRFLSGTRRGPHLHNNNEVLQNVREGANRHGRTWAIMYDVSGNADIKQFKTDWMRLVGRMKVGRDPKDKAYLHHNGKPLMAIWGLFANREGAPEFFLEALEFVKNDPKYGGFSVMVGCENNWRTGKSKAYDKVRAAILKADIVSPWTVGRYRDPNGAAGFVKRLHVPDIQWCKQKKLDFLPVVFPGFSWHNLKGAKLDQIPRRGGEFFWRQIIENRKAGAEMLYIAMFDEIDEGTAICKVSDNPPVGDSPFLTYKGLPKDHYMWLAGQAGKLLRSKKNPPEKMPTRKKNH